MTPAAAAAAARYNVRSVQRADATSLRDELQQLRVPTHRLPVLASHATVEALAISGLTAAHLTALEEVVAERGGALLNGVDGAAAVLIVSLEVAGSLRARLAAWGGDVAELGAAIGDAVVAGGSAPPPLHALGRRLEFETRTLVMGIVNVTPDSFSGDGVHGDIDAAVRLGVRMASEGADVIDIGGESTRPNSAPISADEERARALPVVRQLVRSVDVPVSIDTRKAEVAADALEAGAAMVNDIWGLRRDAGMAPLLAQHPDAALVVMHNQRGTDYGNLIADVCAGLRESLALAAAAGIAEERVIIDPGFGFGKTPAQNLELVRKLEQLRGIGRPVLVGPSRKSTIGILTGGADAGDRLAGSLAMAALAVARGAHMVRVHDVGETVRALAIADAVVRGTPDAMLALPRPGPTG